MTELELSHRRLTRVRVEGLLERFDHDISFDPNWRFLILHGPNGVGKTRLLEFLHSVFNGRYVRLTRIPFHNARLEFHDGAAISITRVRPSSESQLILDEETMHPGKPDEETLFFELEVPGRIPASCSIAPSIEPEDRRMMSRIARDYPVQRIDYDLWMDLPTGDTLTFPEIVERYELPIASEAISDKMPDDLLEALGTYKVHFIETQRLLNPHQSFQRPGPSRVEYPAQQSTVVSYAEDLRHELDRVLATNSRTSQELDRSFPSRLFKEELEAETEMEAQLRERYNEQLNLRSRLADIAILASSADLRLPDRSLEPWEQKVFRTYLDDAAAKLETFQPLLHRLELLREIINERFLFKDLAYDRDTGFIFEDEDSEILLNLKELSSGEQHELVLFYDLLMNVEEHSLVLIDEPEISLHVAWQKAFLNDLDRVASLTSLRFIIATHSPQIIGNWWDQAVELYNTNR